LAKNPRSRELFDKDWTFYLGDIEIPDTVKAGMAAGLTDVVKREEGQHLEIAFVDKESKAKVDPETWRKLDLPHDWVVEGKHTQSEDDADKSHGFLPRGVGFYRKVFKLSDADKGKKIVLEFDGVFRNSRVWLNGQVLKDHRSGYTSFEADLTDNARYGKEGENCLLVRVNAKDTEGWWYEGGGIYRHVWLRKTEKVHVAQWGTYVTTPKVSEKKARLNLEIKVVNESSEKQGFSLKTVVVDPKGREVASANSKGRLAPDGTVEVDQKFRISKPKLWSIENPSLYKAVTTLSLKNKVADVYETPFGIRSIEFKKDGFYLNGEHLVIKGTCNHQDFAGVGVALPDSLHEFKIKRLKEMGSNAYRCAHHPPAPEILEACDRLGMLVMDENRQLDSSDKGLCDLESMILRDRNHPSVILWCLENEEPLQGTERGARMVETLVRRTHALDPTRPTVTAMNHGYYGGGYAEKLDLTGFNYGHRDKHLDVAYHAKFPKRLLIGTETTSDCSTRGIYSDDKERGYLNAYGDAAVTNEWLALWTCRYEVPWQSLLKHPYLTGMFVWTGFDYRGEPSPYGWPCINSHFGIMDTCGFPKDEYYYYKANWSEKPVLHLFPHWNWEGKDGQEIRVQCLSNCEEVELFLNGKSLGKQKAVREDHLEWKVPYAAGELKAVGTGGIGGKLETVIQTAGPAASIRLLPDRTSLRADGRDAMPLRVEVLDAEGRILPTASNFIKFSLSGPAKIIGVGNGDPSCHEPDKAEGRSAFNGLCMVILQSTGTAGNLTLKAEADGLKSAELVLRAGSR
jgi:beta-galactosidase